MIFEFLARLTALLDDANVPYMLAGSVASSFHGEPRATQDVDLVVSINVGALRRLQALVSPNDYYLDFDTARQAIERRSQFNIIDLATGWKCHLIVIKDTDFARTEFQRRQRVEVDELSLWIASAEDVVLSKLVWARQSGASERQMRDAASVLHSARESIDGHYLERWADELGVASELKRIMDPLV